MTYNFFEKLWSTGISVTKRILVNLWIADIKIKPQIIVFNW